MMRQNENNKENANALQESPKFKEDPISKASPQRPSSGAGTIKEYPLKVLDEEEGRVIKVQKGKSFAVGEVAAKTVKDEKANVTVNQNKTSALRAQLASKKK